MTGSIQILIEGFADCFFHFAEGDANGTFIFEVKNTGFTPFTGVVMEIPAIRLKSTMVASNLKIPVGLLLPRMKKRITLTWAIKGSSDLMKDLYNDGASDGLIAASGTMHFVPRFLDPSILHWHSDKVAAIRWKGG